MTPLSLHIHRFGSVIDEVFEFPTGPGLYFLSGANGSGKSTVWKALTWCLFGKDAKGLKAGDVANWSEPEGACVELVFDSGMDWHRVSRTHAPNTWTMENAGEMTAGGDAIDLTRDERNELYAMLQLDFSTWLHTALLAQDEPMFLDLKASEKATLFAEVMQLDRWQRYAEKASGKQGAEDLEMRRLERDEARLRGELSSIADFSEQMTAWDREHVVELLEIVAKYDNKLSESKKVKAKFAEASLASGLAQGVLRDSIEILRDNEHTAGLEKCPQCGAVGTAETRKRVEDAREAAEKARSSSQGADATLRSERIAVEAIERELDRLEELSDAVQHKPNPFAGLQESAAADRERIGREHRQRAGELVRATERYEMLGFWVRGFKEVRLGLIAECLGHLAAEVNGCLPLLGLDGWELIFEVDRETKSGSIARGFNVYVQGPDNSRQVPWESWSGGEAQRLRLATQMGLANLIRASTGASIALEVWDEPSNGLEARGIDDLLFALRERAQIEKRQIWVTDHHALGSSAFDGTVQVTKDNEGTHYAGVE